ncbi:MULTISPECIES: hypothetical protein [Microbacterium]|uniref:hypothetical protein n=1 Tax=Microbacterium TaxID=33882 RepID=UPI0011EACD73|nr:MULTISPECIES: hypothetical protein [Microbacterium]
MESDDAEELRALERAAYGRDGGLDAAASRRLRELQEKHRRRAVAADAGPASTPEPPTEAEPAAPTAVSDPGPAAPAEPDGERAPEPRPVARRVIVPVLAAAAALLAIGVGAGWGLFASRMDAVALTPEQDQRRLELAGEGYDPGSVRPVAEAEGALAWFATQDDGGTRCLILDLGEDSQTACMPQDEVAPGLFASLPAVDGDGEDAVSVDSVSATMIFSTTDEPMVSIQRWSAGSSTIAQFEGPQRARAEELVRDGYTVGLTLLGSFREQPVWLGDRPSEDGPTQRCLIVDADGSRQCTALSEAVEAGLGVQVTDVEQTSGAVLAISVIEVAFTRWQVPYLTVTTASTAAGTLSGDSYLVTTGPPGDPIRIDIPGGDPDG